MVTVVCSSCVRRDPRISPRASQIVNVPMAETHTCDLNVSKRSHDHSILGWDWNHDHDLPRPEADEEGPPREEEDPAIHVDRIEDGDGQRLVIDRVDIWRSP